MDIVHPFKRELEVKELPVRWTAEYVAARLLSGVRCVQRLRICGAVPSAGRSWPSYMYEPEDMWAQAQGPSKEAEKRAQAMGLGAGAEEDAESRGPPTAHEISLMNESIAWPLEYLFHDEKLSRAVGLFLVQDLRSLTRREVERLDKDFSAYEIKQHSMRGLTHIAFKLNQKGVVIR